MTTTLETNTDFSALSVMSPTTAQAFMNFTTTSPIEVDFSSSFFNCTTPATPNGTKLQLPSLDEILHDSMTVEPAPGATTVPARSPDMSSSKDVQVALPDDELTDMTEQSSAMESLSLENDPAMPLGNMHEFNQGGNVNDNTFSDFNVDEWLHQNNCIPYMNSPSNAQFLQNLPEPVFNMDSFNGLQPQPDVSFQHGLDNLSQYPDPGASFTEPQFPYFQQERPQFSDAWRNTASMVQPRNDFAAMPYGIAPNAQMYESYSYNYDFNVPFEEQIAGVDNGSVGPTSKKSSLKRKQLARLDTTDITEPSHKKKRVHVLDSVTTTSPLTPRRAITPDDDSVTPVRNRAVQPRSFGAACPVKDEEHDWVRINTKTQGGKRTGKINGWDPKKDGRYKDDIPHPTGSWTSASGFKFEYNRWGELLQPPKGKHHQSSTTYTAEQLRAFIYEHPHDETTRQRLVMFIQRAPADSARRYPTKSGDCCRFKDCPGHVYGNRINLGTFRVAFDERWTTTGDQQDPFHVAGYVHLYCLEQFLDFADICHKFDVRADDRIFPLEPLGHFRPSLNNAKEVTSEYKVAADFIRRCKTGNLLSKYPYYPQHPALATDGLKEHKQTLLYALMKAKTRGYSNSKKEFLLSRGSADSHFLVHMGDLAMQMRAKVDMYETQKAEKAANPRKRRGRNARDSDDDDDTNEETQPTHKRARQNTTKKSKRTTTRRAADSEEEESDFEP